MYQLLWPNENVPSPCKLFLETQNRLADPGQSDFEAPQDHGPLSPESPALADFAAFARRELRPMVEASILEVFQREIQPIEESLMASLINTFQDCHARLFRSWSERIGHDQPINTTPDHMENTLPNAPLASPAALFPSYQYQVDEGSSMHTPADFLNPTSHGPPPFQGTDFEPDFQFHDSMHSFQATHPVDASLSSSSEALFSANGYGTEYTSTTVASQNQAAESACPPGEPDFQTDVLWRDWANNPC